MDKKQLAESNKLPEWPSYENTTVTARIFKVSTSFLYKNWRKIPAARLAGRALRWDIQGLSEWMQQQAQGTESKR